MSLRINILSVFAILLSTAFSLNAQTADAYKGTYQAVKCVKLPISEKIEVEEYLTKTLVIDSKFVALFSDSTTDVSYQVATVDKAQYFQEYRNFDMDLLPCLEDSVTVLTARSTKDGDKESLDILICDQSLIAEYSGHFFIFKKQ